MKTLIVFLIGASALAGSLSEPSRFPPLNPATKFKIPALDPEQKGLFPVREVLDCEGALLTNGHIAFGARFHFGYRAKTIRAQALLLKADALGFAMAKMLKDNVANGGVSQVIVDPISNMGNWQTQWMYYDLRENGVDIEGYEPGFGQLLNEFNPEKLEEYNMRYHEKIFVTDGEHPELPTSVYIGGGMNEENPYGRIGTVGKDRWRDQDMIFRGAPVQDATVMFDRNMAELKRIKKVHPDLFRTDRNWQGWRLGARKIWHKIVPILAGFELVRSPMNEKEVQFLVEKSKSMSIPFERMRARLFQSRPRLGETYIHEGILQAIETAKDEVVILNAYLVADPEFTEIAQAAARRGVHLVLMTNSRETNDLKVLSDVGRSKYKTLLAVNFEPEVMRLAAQKLKPGRQMIEVWEWQGDFYNGTVHAKAGVVDGEMGWVASYNLDNRSWKLNSENGAFFESNTVAGELRSQMLKRDIRLCRKISWEEAQQYKEPKNISEAVRLQLALPLEKQL